MPDSSLYNFFIPHLQAYLRFMNKAVTHGESPVKIRLQFLAHEEEARLEHQALYALHGEANESGVERVLATDQGESFAHTLVLSMGSSSTQAHLPAGVVGHFQFGTSQLPDMREVTALVATLQPWLAQYAIRSVLLVGSPGYWIQAAHCSHIDIRDRQQIKAYIGQAQAEGSLFLHQLADAFERMAPGVSVYLKNRQQQGRTIQFAWLDPLAVAMRSWIGHEAHQHYLVDFGGGGIAMHCLRCHAQPWVRKDRFLKNYVDAQGYAKDLQPSFVHAVTTSEAPGTHWIVQMAKQRMVDLALQHAQAVQAQGAIHLYVYQTGLLRALYEQGQAGAVRSSAVAEKLMASV